MKKISSALSHLSGNLNTLISFLVIILMIFLSLLLGISVFFRYVLNNSIYWAGEVSRYTLVWLSFFGSTVAYKKGAHIGIDLFGARFPSSKKALKLIALVLMLLFWALIVKESIKLEQLYFYQKTSTLNIPYSYPFAALPVSALIWIVHITSDILKGISKS